jgi:hypothetical protein
MKTIQCSSTQKSLDEALRSISQMYCGDPHILLLGTMLPCRKNQVKLSHKVNFNGIERSDLMIQVERKGSLVTLRLYLLMPSVTTVKEKVDTKPVISRKEVEYHIRWNTVYLDHLGLQVFTDYDTDPEKPVLRIEGVNGLVKVFTSSKSAKSWLTREDNKALQARVNRDHAMTQPLERKLDYIRHAY